LVFDGVSRVAFAAFEGYDRIIMSAVVEVSADGVFWSPDLSGEEDDQSTWQPGTAIAARQLWWRPLENALGSNLRYAGANDLPFDAVP
jgi:hypothetical protein